MTDTTSSNDDGFLPYDPEDLDYGKASEILRSLIDQVDLEIKGWNPEDKPKVFGVVKDITEAGGEPYGVYPLIIIQTPSGQMIGVHCFHTVLKSDIERRISRGRLNIGDNIAILHKGEKEAGAGKQAFHDYQVAVAPPGR